MSNTKRKPSLLTIIRRLLPYRMETTHGDYEDVGIGRSRPVTVTRYVFGIVTHTDTFHEVEKEWVWQDGGWQERVKTKPCVPLSECPRYATVMDLILRHNVSPADCRKWARQRGIETEDSVVLHRMASRMLANDSDFTFMEDHHRKTGIDEMPVASYDSPATMNKEQDS
jgi:hypothetical protein